jgi:putative FmdB family regulatory protein
MPIYEFHCDNCNKQYEIKMSMSEHENQKDKLTCQECHVILTQSVAPLNFKLNGHGWFGKSDTCVDPYGITDMETNHNLDMEKRIEGESHSLSAKEQNIKEI